MIYSMTGFGRAAGALSPRFHVAVTAKSVNHRFLETSVRLPEYLWELEAPVRAIASESCSRGKLDISVRVQRTQQPEYQVRINTPIANSVIPQLRSIAEELGLGGTFSGGDLLRLPDFLQVDAVESDITDEEREALARLVREALAQLQTMRAREGESLHADTAGRLQTIRKLQQQASAVRDTVLAELLT